MNKDDFKNLKNARYKLESIIQKNDFDPKIENELKEVQRLLNAIHSRNTNLEENPERGA